jgi:carbonic anhydrase/acetyltransferase-like protein (isoleucine patch superfamily)
LPPSDRCRIAAWDCNRGSSAFICSKGVTRRYVPLGLPALRRSAIRAYSAAVWESRVAQRQLAERGEMSRISELFSARLASQKKSRGMDFGLSLVDPRAWFQLFRLVHYYNYDHVRPLRVADIGQGVRMAPNVSLRNGERIKIGDFSHIGARCSLWAGDSVGRITLGRYALLGPEVFITASNYRTERGTPVMNQPRVERGVVVGDDVWLGARVVVVGRFPPVRSRSGTRRVSSAAGVTRKAGRRFATRTPRWAPPERCERPAGPPALRAKNLIIAEGVANDSQGPGI